MTAQSQLVSSKVLRTFVKRGFRSFLLSALEGEVAKRAFDVIFSLSVLILLSPLYLLIMIAVALSSRGPIFYVQERVGKNSRRFGCIKFRTMVKNADHVLNDLIESCPELRAEFADNFKLKRDPRVTLIGQFLRMTSLDEFPQFLNVLMGHMSVVGPRPVVPEEIERYGRHADRVFSIRPGITGLWQVSGRNDIPYPKRVMVDLYYVNFRSVLMDFWIIFKTVGIVLFPKDNGAY